MTTTKIRFTNATFTADIVDVVSASLQGAARVGFETKASELWEHKLTDQQHRDAVLALAARFGRQVVRQVSP